MIEPVAAAAEREVALATGRPLFPNSKGDGASANRDYGVEVMENGFFKCTQDERFSHCYQASTRMRNVALLGQPSGDASPLNRPMFPRSKTACTGNYCPNRIFFFFVAPQLYP
jgi:hypothetical protein